MFAGQKLRSLKKEINANANLLTDEAGNVLINVRAESRAQIFSSYEYNTAEKLNDQLADYLEDRICFVPPAKPVKIRIYTHDQVDEAEVKNEVRANYRLAYLKTRLENRKNWLFTGAMFLMGLVFLTLLLLSIHFLDNVFIDTILEIFSWVFIWEMADALFLRRGQFKIKLIRYLQLYTAQVEIIREDRQR